jgi:hypothetical protein
VAVGSGISVSVLLLIVSVAGASEEVFFTPWPIKGGPLPQPQVGNRLIFPKTATRHGHGRKLFSEIGLFASRLAKNFLDNSTPPGLIYCNET